MKSTSINDQLFLEKRASEIRSCPQCALVIQSPFVERCPRCFAILPRIDITCQGCLYETLCPVSPGRKARA